MKKTALILFTLVTGLYAYGQETETSADTLRKDALNVFMEASDFVRKEIPYINYVRDIKDADVYIISTYQPTGSGGVEYTYYLVGQHAFAGKREIECQENYRELENQPVVVSLLLQGKF